MAKKIRKPVKRRRSRSRSTATSTGRTDSSKPNSSNKPQVVAEDTWTKKMFVTQVHAVDNCWKIFLEENKGAGLVSKGSVCLWIPKKRINGAPKQGDEMIVDIQLVEKS